MTKRRTAFKFLLVLVLALCVLRVSACRCSTGTPGAGASAGPWLPMAKTGPETWSSDGTQYNVAATYYLTLPDGLQYTIDYPAPASVDFDGMNDARAFEATAPLMRYAVSANFYSRQVIRDSSGNAVPVRKIGVSLFSQSGVRTRGYRVARTLEQLRQSTPRRSVP